MFLHEIFRLQKIGGVEGGGGPQAAQAQDVNKLFNTDTGEHTIYRDCMGN